MRKIPTKNYFILLLLFAATAGIVLFASEVYESRTRKQYTSIMNSFITEIKINDLDYYTLDNSPVVIYISDKTDVDLGEDEQRYKDLLIEYNIQNYFVYLNVSDESIDVIKSFEELYNVDIAEETLPNLVVIDEGKVIGIYSYDIFNKTGVIDFLTQKGVIESD